MTIPNGAHPAPDEPMDPDEILRRAEAFDPLPRITAASREVVFQLEASDEALLGSNTGVECEITVRAAGQEIRQRTGKGNLRIDPKL
jgi:hypothetical protein